MKEETARVTAGAGTDPDFQNHLAEAVRFHGHLCGGQVLGVRMAMAGLRELGIRDSRGKEGMDLVIFIEIDRCIADAIISVTGRTPGKRSIKLVDYGKTAATFVDTGTGKAVRVSLRKGAHETLDEITRRLMPELDEKTANIQALTVIPEEALLAILRVRVDVSAKDRPGESLNTAFCDACGEMVRDCREIRVGEKLLCRPCAEKKAYYEAI